MRDADAILRFVLERISQIYQRPLMYGGSPEGVDLVLHYYHELVAEILECRPAFEASKDKAHEEAGAIASGFSKIYRRIQGNPDEHKTVDYVVLQWRKIDALMGLNVPDRRSTQQPRDLP